MRYRRAVDREVRWPSCVLLPYLSSPTLSSFAQEDVELLARCLTQGISLDKWETERRRRVAIITAATKDSGRTRKVGQRASWIGYQVKTLIMAAYFNLPLGIEQRGRGIFGYDSEKEFKA